MTYCVSSESDPQSPIPRNELIEIAARVDAWREGRPVTKDDPEKVELSIHRNKETGNIFAVATRRHPSGARVVLKQKETTLLELDTQAF